MELLLSQRSCGFECTSTISNPWSSIVFRISKGEGLIRSPKVRFDVGQVFNLPAFHSSSGRLKTCPTTFWWAIKRRGFDLRLMNKDC